jgi:hypothetical protein
MLPRDDRAVKTSNLKGAHDFRLPTAAFLPPGWASQFAPAAFFPRPASLPDLGSDHSSLPGAGRSPVRADRTSSAISS